MWVKHKQSKEEMDVSSTTTRGGLVETRPCTQSMISYASLMEVVKICFLVSDFVVWLFGFHQGKANVAFISLTRSDMRRFKEDPEANSPKCQ